MSVLYINWAKKKVVFGNRDSDFRSAGGVTVIGICRLTLICIKMRLAGYCSYLISVQFVECWLFPPDTTISSKIPAGLYHSDRSYMLQLLQPEQHYNLLYYS